MNSFIKQSAISLGFDACGIAEANKLTADADFFKQWLADGKHAEMRYLERNFDKRADPRLLVPDCKSVVVVLLNYYNDIKQPAFSPKIARYTHSAVDYHTVIKEKLNKLEAVIVEKYGENAVNNAVQHSFTDSAPIFERRWAERAGLGWIGRNTQLVANDLGSFCFIGCLLLNIEMEYDTPVKNLCGNCKKCENACPAKALENGTLDARKCISYQTIENKQFINEDFRHFLSGYIVGCDICANICPHNKKLAKPHNHKELEPIKEISSWTKSDWQNIEEKQFNDIFKHSAIKRLKFEKLKDNLKSKE